jgi:Na+-translocating ferredoxin:NAD+ oxidoreductase subunit G
MTKLPSTIKNMILSLLIISATMSAALASVYLMTKDQIELAKKMKEVNAIKAVLPEFTNDPTETKKEIGELTVYTAVNNNDTLGYAVKTLTKKAFSGTFTLMVGFLKDGTIHNIEIIEQKETPGLGDKIKTKWKDQFKSKNPETFKLVVKKDGGPVDAITAATISSRAFCDAVGNAYNVIRKGGSK